MAVTRAVSSSRLVDRADRAARSLSIPGFLPPNRLGAEPGPPGGWKMVLRRPDLRGTGSDDLRRRLPRPVAQTEPPVAEVRAVLEDVRTRGDAALRDLVERFDGPRLDDLRVAPEDVAAALDAIPPDLPDPLG